MTALSSMMMIAGSLFRWPHSKSFWSWAGVTFTTPRAELGIDQDRVADHGDLAVQEREDRPSSDERLVARVLGMDGHGRVAEHRLGTRRRHREEAPGLALHGVADVPELAGRGVLGRLHLEVGKRGLVSRAPVGRSAVPGR